MASILDLPPEILLLVVQSLELSDLFTFLSIPEVLYALSDDIKLLSPDPKYSIFFHLPWNESQLIKLNKSSEISVLQQDRPIKRQKITYPGSFQLIELPEYDLSQSFTDVESIVNNNKQKYIAITNIGLQREAALSFTKLMQIRTLSDNRSEVSKISFKLQRCILKLLSKLPSHSYLILGALRNFTSFDSLIDPTILHFPYLESLCLVNPKIPKDLSHKFLLPNLDTLRIEEGTESSGDTKAISALDLMDFSMYPKGELWYFYSTFIHSENEITLFVENKSFDLLEDLAVLESVTHWKNIKFPVLEELLISTIKKNDHTKYSYFTNIEAPQLSKLTIEYDCGHFPRITNMKLSKSVLITIKGICNVFWTHHHDTTLISQVNQFLDDYQDIELYDAIDLLGCSPLSNVKTLKVICQSYYWHMTIHTVPKPLYNLEKLIIKLDNDTYKNTPIIPAPNLKELKAGNSKFICYKLVDINYQYPKLEKLLVALPKFECLNVKDLKEDQLIFKHLKVMILNVLNYLELMECFNMLNKYKFPKLETLIIYGVFTEQNISIEFPNAPNLKILNLGNADIGECEECDSNLKLSGFKNLEVLCSPSFVNNLQIDEISNLKRLILPDDEIIYKLNHKKVSSRRGYKQGTTSIKVELMADNDEFDYSGRDGLSYHLDFGWPAY